MNKIDKYVLDNGLKVFLYNDNNKHSVTVNLFIKFGGNNKRLIIKDKEYKIKDGTAHFMEHLLYEHSIYGDSHITFNKNHTFSNAYTNTTHTNFYINSVVNFKEDLIKIINIVNNPCFTHEDVEKVRSAIIKEKMMSKDSKFANLNKASYECLFNNIKFPNVLGEVDDINNITYEELKLCYDTFYNPNNQILFIAGNFNTKEIKKVIEDTYNSLESKYIEYKIPDIKEKNIVFKCEKSIYEDIHMDYTRISYKIYTGNLLPYDRVKLSFYIPFFLNQLVGATSNLYQELVKEGICTYDIDYGFDQIYDYTIIDIGTFTDKKEIFVNKIIDCINNKSFDEKKFELSKKDNIIKIILREDNLSSLINPLIDNVLIYDYDKFDTIEDANSYTFIDFNKMINSLDFTNYCITYMEKKYK